MRVASFLGNAFFFPFGLQFAFAKFSHMLLLVTFPSVVVVALLIPPPGGNLAPLTSLSKREIMCHGLAWSLGRSVCWDGGRKNRILSLQKISVGSAVASIHVRVDGHGWSDTDKKNATPGRRIDWDRA